MGKSPCYLKKEMWSDDPDNAKRFAYMSKQGTGNYKIPEIGKYGKTCKLRRTDHTKGSHQQESFTQQEEELIIKLHAAIGSRWPIIAQQLPGRTDNDVKTIWNTKLRKKLTAMGIDPVTHRPFSQILADYGNIGAFPKARTRFGSLSRNIKTSFTLRSDDSQISSNEDSGFSTTISHMNNSDEHSAHNHSLNLLSQLQAITLITEASNYKNHEFFMPTHLITDCSSSSSTESPCSNTNQVMASPVFNWSDFLLEDAYPQGNAREKGIFVNSSADMTVEEKKDDKDAGMNNFQASLPSSSSFVEGILESENEMLLDFQGLLEEPFYY